MASKYLVLIFLIKSINANSDQSILSQVSFHTHTVVPNIIYGVRQPGAAPRPKTPAFRWSAPLEERSDHYINRVLSNHRKVNQPTTIKQTPSIQPTPVYIHPIPASQQTPTDRNNPPQSHHHQNHIQHTTPTTKQPNHTKKRPQVLSNIAKSVMNATPRTEQVIPQTPRSIIGHMSPINLKTKDPNSVEIEANLIVLETRDNDEISFPSNRRRVEKVIIRHANANYEASNNDTVDNNLTGRSETESQSRCTCNDSPNARVIILSITLSLISIITVIVFSSRYILKYKRKCENQDEMVRAECVRVEGFGSHRLMFGARA